VRKQKKKRSVQLVAVHVAIATSAIGGDARAVERRTAPLPTASGIMLVTKISTRNRTPRLTRMLKRGIRSEAAARARIETSLR
jgi:hypothetical protein